MSLRIARPAPLAELTLMHERDALPAAARKRDLTPRHLARMQSFGGRSWGLWDGEACVACFGLYPCPAPRTYEAWFAASAAAPRHMLAIARLAQLTGRAALQTGTVAITASVADGHRPGERLAAAIGFRRIGTGGGFGVWLLDAASPGMGAETGAETGAEMGAGMGDQ